MTFKRKNKDQIRTGNIILIDLMPQTRREILETREVTRKWFFGSIAVVAACIVASLSVYSFSLTTGQKMKEETSAQNIVSTKIEQYSSLNQALESQTLSNDYLAKATASESNWSQLFRSVESSLPSGTEIVSMKVSIGSGKKEESVAILTLNFSSSTTLGYSDTLKAVQSLPGVSGVEIGGLSVGGSGYRYSMAFAHDSSILTKRFVKESVLAKTPPILDGIQKGSK